MTFMVQTNRSDLWDLNGLTSIWGKVSDDNIMAYGVWVEDEANY